MHNHIGIFEVVFTVASSLNGNTTAVISELGLSFCENA
jgi:hypothetical protein